MSGILHSPSDLVFSLLPPTPQYQEFPTLCPTIEGTWLFPLTSAVSSVSVSASTTNCFSLISGYWILLQVLSLKFNRKDPVGLINQNQRDGVGPIQQSSRQGILCASPTLYAICPWFTYIFSHLWPSWWVSLVTYVFNKSKIISVGGSKQSIFLRIILNSVFFSNNTYFKYTFSSVVSVFAHP